MTNSASTRHGHVDGAGDALEARHARDFCAAQPSTARNMQWHARRDHVKCNEVDSASERPSCRSCLGLDVRKLGRFEVILTP